MIAYYQNQRFYRVWPIRSVVGEAIDMTTDVLAAGCFWRKSADSSTILLQRECALDPTSSSVILDVSSLPLAAGDYYMQTIISHAGGSFTIVASEQFVVLTAPVGLTIGSDTVDGGDGNDTLVGGDGNDYYL